MQSARVSLLALTFWEGSVAGYPMKQGLVIYSGSGQTLLMVLQHCQLNKLPL